MTAPAGAPRVLLVGGGGGLAGRAVLAELLPRFAVRSVHRHAVAAESASGVEWHAGAVESIEHWEPLCEGVDAVVNLAWYRWESPRRFAALARGLERLIAASRTAGVRRFVQVSVPAAPEELERSLPYLYEKRAVDRALEGSGLSYRILRPTMLFGRGDRLLGVMLRMMWRYRAFPMFGAGEYRVSPLAAADLARAVHRELGGATRGTVDLGGPERLPYRELTDRMFAALGRRPRYVHLSPAGAVRLTRVLRAFGSTLLYPYEVTWLLSDRLGLAPDPGATAPLEPVDAYLRAEARRLGVARAGLPVAGPTPSAGVPGGEAGRTKE